MFSIWILVDDNPRSEPLSDHVRSLVCRLCGGTVDWPSFSRPRLLDALGVLLNVYQELIPRLGPLPISWLGLKVFLFLPFLPFFRRTLLTDAFDCRCASGWDVQIINF